MYVKVIGNLLGETVKKDFGEQFRGIFEGTSCVKKITHSLTHSTSNHRYDSRTQNGRGGRISV